MNIFLTYIQRYFSENVKRKTKGFTVILRKVLLFKEKELPLDELITRDNGTEGKLRCVA